MRVFVESWSGELDGFGPASELPVVDRSLGEVLGPAGELQPGTVVLEAGAVVGPHLVEAVAALGLTRDTRIRIGGRTGALLEEIALGEDPTCVRWHSGSSDPAEELELDPAERLLPVPMPGGESLPLSDRFALRVRHPVQLLWANLLSLPPRLWRRLVGEGLGAGLRLAGAALRAGSTRPEAVAAALSRTGGADVHPTAVVEASVLEAGARVGAGAIVRGSFLGPGARVEALGICEGSVLAAEAVVQRQALCRYCLLGEGAMLGGAAQLAIFGPGSGLKRGSYAMDQGLGQDVRVPVGEALRRAPLGLMGPTFGPGTQVGSGVWIAPGRVLPAGIVVLGPDPLRDPRPPDHDGPYRVKDGSLR